MRKICALGALVLFAAALQSAEIWTGQLFDANCVAQNRELQKYEECTPKADTASFELQVSGRMLKLDADGDRKAAAAWKEYVNSADRVIDPDFKKKPLTAVIEGTANGDMLKVDSILLR